jgi:hypothetical protein
VVVRAVTIGILSDVVDDVVEAVAPERRVVASTFPVVLAVELGAVSPACRFPL